CALPISPQPLVFGFIFSRRPSDAMSNGPDEIAHELGERRARRVGNDGAVGFRERIEDAIPDEQARFLLKARKHSEKGMNGHPSAPHLGPRVADDAEALGYGEL